MIFPSNWNGMEIPICLNEIWKKLLLQIFAHGTRAHISWHVQKFVAIYLPWIELEQNDIFRRIWNTMDESLVQWAQDLCLHPWSTSKN